MRASPHIAPAGLGSGPQRLQWLIELALFYPALQVPIVTDPIPIPALNCPCTPELGLPSTHSYGYGSQSSPAPRRTCPAPTSGMLMQYAS